MRVRDRGHHLRPDGGPHPGDTRRVGGDGGRTVDGSEQERRLISTIGCTDAFEALRERDLGFSAGVVVDLGDIGTGVVDVDVPRDGICDARGGDVGVEVVVQPGDDLVEAVGLARPEAVDARQPVVGGPDGV